MRERSSTLRIAGAVCISMLLASCASAPSPSLSQAARSELAPTGKIRVGINFGNRLFARKDAAGEPSGIAIDLARELGRRSGIPIEIVGYESAGRLTAAVGTNAWDIAFLAYEQAREKDIRFAAAFAEVDATYLVQPGSSLRHAEAVDRDGIRVAVSAKGGNDLFLSRTLKQASLVRVPTSSTADAFKVFVSDRLDAYAGLKPTLIALSVKLPGSRVLDGRYTVIPYSVGTVQGREAGARYLREFIEGTKASGQLAELIVKNGIEGVSAAPRMN
jgi:polar amino acid transport system substrate-binding protein